MDVKSGFCQKYFGMPFKSLEEVICIRKYSHCIDLSELPDPYFRRSHYKSHGIIGCIKIFR